MDRYYLDKKNVENQFMFYRLIQLLLDECLQRIGMPEYRMNKVFRKKLYLEFMRYDGVVMQAGCALQCIIIKFTMKKGTEEIEFGRLLFESSKVSELYNLR